MEGKYSLKHLYNNGKSSQMKPLEFIDLMNWLDQNADGMIGDAVEVTEKIDGSSNFIGYDGRIYVEKFGFDKKFYDESDFDNPFSGAKARALLDFAHSIPELPDYLEDLCNDNSCSSVKIQIEVLMTKFSKAPDVCQVVLVPYELNKLGKDGSGFIIQVLNGDTLKPVVDEKIAVDTLCDIMSSDNFHVTGTNPKQFTPIDIKEDIQEVKNIIADYTESMGKSVEEILTSRKRSEAEMKKALKAEIENIQEALQDKLSEAFPVGDYGEYYEGLVFKLTNGMMFKVTSKKFKQFMAEHNHWNESLENKYGRLTEAEENNLLFETGDLTIDDNNYFDETEGIEDDTDILDEINKIKKEIFSSVYKLGSNDFQECEEETGEKLLKKYFCPDNGQSLYFQKPSSVTNSLLYISSATITPSENKIPNAKLSGITSELKDTISEVLKGNNLKEEKLNDFTNKSKMNKELKNLQEKSFYIQDSDTQNLQRKIVYINDDKTIYRLILATTGGKHCKGLCFYRNGQITQTVVATSSKSQFKGLTSTNIQECISGVLLYEVLFTKDKSDSWKKNFDSLCDSLTKSETTEQLYDSLASIKLKDKPGNFDHYHFQAAYVGKGGENTSLLLFKPSISGALHDWTESLKKIKDVTIKLEEVPDSSSAAKNRLTSPENTLLFHSSFLYSSEVSEGKKEPQYIINPDAKQLLDEYLFSDSFFKKSSKEDGPKSFRDEVNPSDIYLISKNDINKIIQLFGSVEQLSQGTDTLKTLLDKLMEFFKKSSNQNDFLVKARAYIGSTEENSIIDTIYNDFTSSREEFPSYKDGEVSIYNKTKKTMKDLETLINSMLGRALREKTSTTRSHLINICRSTTFARILSEKIGTETLKEFLNNDDVLMTLVSYGEDPIPKSVAYATIHNFLTQQRYIAGISLKKLASKGAFTFTGGNNFFLTDKTVNRETIQPTIGRNMLIYNSNDLDKCTLKNLHIAVGVPEGVSSPTQGGLKIICESDQSHVHGTLSKQKSSLKYNFKGILSLIREGNPLITNGLMLDHILEDTDRIINYVSSYTDEKGNKWFVNNGMKADIEDKNSILTLDVRTNGNGVVIESGVGGSAAQGGKATNAFNKLYKGNPSTESLSQEEMEKGLSKLSKEAKAEKLRYYLKVLSQSVLDFLGLAPAYSTSTTKTEKNLEPVKNSNIETFSDETLNKALNIILAHQNNNEEETQQWAVVCFKLTLLFARALKYQIFIEGDLGNADISDNTESLSKAQQSLNTFKSYFKYHVNLSSVAYYKLS